MSDFDPHEFPRAVYYDDLPANANILAACERHIADLDRDAAPSRSCDSLVATRDWNANLAMPLIFGRALLATISSLRAGEALTRAGDARGAAVLGRERRGVGQGTGDSR